LATTAPNAKIADFIDEIVENRDVGVSEIEN
jgi:hypothetical protein